MTETIQKAINKIDLEAEEEKNTYARVFASHIIDNYLSTDENAEKVLDEKKTIAGCLREVKSKAQKQAESGMAMIEDSTVFGWVRFLFSSLQSTANQIEGHLAKIKSRDQDKADKLSAAMKKVLENIASSL